MKKFLFYILSFIICIDTAIATVRNGRTKNTPNTQQRLTTSKSRTGNSTIISKKNISSRIKSDNNTPTRTSIISTPQKTKLSNETNNLKKIKSRSTTTPTVQTRTGTAYEQCKESYFTCMDQFCTLKNSDYQRCSCSDKIYNIETTLQTFEDANTKLTSFNENLDIVGLTTEQALAMKTSSEGEDALTSDKSASKALLQAIMNSIRGEKTNVGGKYSDLNSINLSFDTTNAFGITDSGQTIANNNGSNLYKLVYNQCKNTVKDICNDASLQRAINAYLMAIEQDCNTVTTALEKKQKEMKSAIRESSAMLDLARVENRQKHNSDNVTTCLNNIESAILSEEVCGKNYHKCLDNGEYIDITTGEPIIGVTDFYKLGKMLTFATNTNITEQKLSQIIQNKNFITNFESKTKQFAKDALDKCTEQSDEVWQEYLDKALLAIYYAQNAKVEEIKQNCFDYISNCYTNINTAYTTAIANLDDESSISVKPYSVKLTSQMCTEYVDTCNNMFDNNIIQEYVNNRTNTDTLTACRAVLKQCFDKYGGDNYENFFNPASGLFTEGEAPKWFALYKYDSSGNREAGYVSPCAKQLYEIEACSDTDLLEQAFGGFDYIETYATKNTNSIEYTLNDSGNNYPTYNYDSCSNTQTYTDNSPMYRYGLLVNNSNTDTLSHRELRSIGVATEVYNQIIDNLSNQCINVQGKFIEYQNLDFNTYYIGNTCLITYGCSNPQSNLTTNYLLNNIENICPSNYSFDVDTNSWGICSCWANGGKRSKNGSASKCAAVLPSNSSYNGLTCKTASFTNANLSSWCNIGVVTVDNIGAGIHKGKTLCKLDVNKNGKITTTTTCDYAIVPTTN